MAAAGIQPPSTRHEGNLRLSPFRLGARPGPGSHQSQVARPLSPGLNSEPVSVYCGPACGGLKIVASAVRFERVVALQEHLQFNRAHGNLSFCITGAGSAAKILSFAQGEDTTHHLMTQPNHKSNGARVSINSAGRDFLRCLHTKCRSGVAGNAATWG